MKIESIQSITGNVPAVEATQRTPIVLYTASQEELVQVEFIMSGVSKAFVIELYKNAPTGSTAADPTIGPNTLSKYWADNESTRAISLSASTMLHSGETIGFRVNTSAYTAAYNYKANIVTFHK